VATPGTIAGVGGEERIPFWDRLDAGERAELEAQGSRRRYPSGVAVFLEGDDAHEAMIILDGGVKVTVLAPDGREHLLDVAGPGTLIGELSAYDGGPRSATVTTLERSEVLSIGFDRFHAFLDRRPHLLRLALAELAAIVRESDQRQLDLGTSDALGRVCGRLVELASRYGDRPAGATAVTIESPLSQADLAAWTGLSREAVVKALRALRKLGWIDNRGSTITVHDLPALAERAGM
jgi:CRP-like cAMP-binding protein